MCAMSERDFHSPKVDLPLGQSKRMQHSFSARHGAGFAQALTLSTKVPASDSATICRGTDGTWVNRNVK
jgi:hypothetical protein